MVMNTKLPSVAESDSTTNSSSSSVNNIVFIGDSRTVGMQQAVGGNDTWSGKVSAGLDWMKSSGVPNVENNIQNGSAVVILMGVK